MPIKPDIKPHHPDNLRGETMKDQLREILERCEAATEGPWQYYDGVEIDSKGPTPVTQPSVESESEIIAEFNDYGHSDNAILIANARTDLPTVTRALLAVVEECEAVLRDGTIEEQMVMAEVLLAKIQKELEAK